VHTIKIKLVDESWVIGLGFEYLKVALVENNVIMTDVNINL